MKEVHHAGHTRKIYGVLLQQNLQLPPATATSKLCVAVFESATNDLLGSVVVSDFGRKLQHFSHVTLKDQEGKRCGTVNLRVDPPVGADGVAEEDSSAGDEEEEEEEDDA